MKSTSSQVRKEVLARLAARKVSVPIAVLRAGDFVEFAAVRGGTRTMKVHRVHPRSRTLELVPPSRADLPRGFKSLAAADGRGATIAESQVLGVLVGTPGRRQTVRPGTDAWVTFTKARAAGGGGERRTEGTGGPPESENAPQHTGPVPGPLPDTAWTVAPPNPVAAFQTELRDAFMEEAAR